MASWRSNDYTYAFSLVLLGLTIPGIISPKFVVDNINNVVIGKILRFLDPLPVPNTKEVIGLYRVIFILAAVIGVIYNVNAKHDTYVRGTLKSLSFISVVLIASYLAGGIR